MLVLVFNYRKTLVPYAFPIDGEQSYISEQTPWLFNGRKLEFIRQNLYGRL
jgi:hypothetical protein